MRILLSLTICRSNDNIDHEIYLDLYVQGYSIRWHIDICVGFFSFSLSLSRAHLFVSKKLKMRRIKHVIEKKDKIEIQYLFDVYFDGSWDIVPFNNRAY